MARKQRKRLILAGIAVLIIGAIVYGFIPETVAVEIATAECGPMQVTVEEEGETQVVNTYLISSPVLAFARRTDLQEGDFVQQGQELIRLESPRSAILDPRTRAEALARIDAAQAALQQAEQQVEAAAAVAEQAREERERIERLYGGGSATKQAMEQAVARALEATSNLEAARASVAAFRADLASARAALEYDTVGNNSLSVQEVLRSPVAGKILAVHHKSEGIVNPGVPLIEIGDTSNLEVHVDVLSQDAVQITPGTRVLLDQWGGDTLLEANVKRIEPLGFTSVSSLGVEEQRVTIVAGITSSPDMRTGLGAGYRVLARFVVWEDEQVLQVPNSALYRTDEGWALFTVEGGEATPRAVTVGHQNGLKAQILSGIEEGEQIIVQPENSIEAGTRVKSL